MLSIDPLIGKAEINHKQIENAHIIGLLVGLECPIATSPFNTAFFSSLSIVVVFTYTQHNNNNNNIFESISTVLRLNQCMHNFAVGNRHSVPSSYSNIDIKSFVCSFDACLIIIFKLKCGGLIVLLVD